MCELCSVNEDERIAACKASDFTADQLEALSGAYRAMSHGELNPHSEEAKKVGNVARSVIRQLVADWV